ncbi:MAG: hypothetical protein IJV31_05065, partial [Clostridia bacterium]|nr:hypothetical protein [Clostridia bacterium]
DANQKTFTSLKLENQTISVGNEIEISKEVYIKILPSVNSTNVEKIEAGTKAEVTNIVNKWYKIEVGDKAGWLRIEQ